MLNNTVYLLNYFIMRKTDIMTTCNYSSTSLIAGVHYLCLQSFHRRRKTYHFSYFLEMKVIFIGMHDIVQIKILVLN